jgi:hypothetical protein
MLLSVQQQAALYEAKQLLRHVGLSLGDTSSSILVNDSQNHLLEHPDNSSFDAQHLNCHPPARRFTEAEILQRKNQVNRQSYLDALVDYPLDSIVEYPCTGETANLSVGHMFAVDPIALPKFSSELSVRTELAEPNGQFGYGSSSGSGSSSQF